jgi:hypothetical protein
MQALTSAWAHPQLKPGARTIGYRLSLEQRVNGLLTTRLPLSPEQRENGLKC